MPPDYWYKFIGTEVRMGNLPPLSNPSNTQSDHPESSPKLFGRITRPIRATAKALVFFFKVFPMLPSRPIDWVTKKPVIDKVTYPTCSGMAVGEVYRPPSPGPHPGILVCLGVVPFGVDHPQVPVLGRALARAGFEAFLYWSPAMRDFRLVPEDIENIALAYEWFIQQPDVDPARSGLLGTCVGGSFAFMAAAHPLIRERVGYIGMYAPFSSMQTFARDIASSSCDNGEGRQPWKVDQLTRRVFVHSIAAELEGEEATGLCQAFEAGNGHYDPRRLSPEGQAVYRLFTASGAMEAELALDNLQADMQARLAVLSPLNYIKDIRAPLIVQLHDAGDQVIPVGESRRLHAALKERAGMHYTEMHFSHLDPVKGKLPLGSLLRELAKFFLAVYPLFHKTVEEEKKSQGEG